MAAWLRPVIVHVAVRSRERDRWRAERERIVARPDAAPSVVEQLERKSLQETLARLVDELGEPYRGVVRLRYLEDREIEEIAASVGRSPGTVRSQLARGLDQLRVRMGVEPRERRKLSALLPWLWRRGERSDRRVGLGPALVLGSAAGVLVIGLFSISTRSTREERVASAPSVEGRPEISLGDLAPAPALRTAVPLSEARGGQPALDPEAEAWTMDVEGEVRAPDGSPVPGAAVLVGEENGNQTEIVAHSDARGHYSVRRVDGRLLLWAEEEQRISSDRHLLGSKEPGRSLDLRLGHPIGTLVGRVLSFVGEPLPRAEVTLLTFLREPSFAPSDQGTLALGPPPMRVRSADDGRFQLGHPPSEEFWLLAQCEGHAPLLLRCKGSRGAREIELTLPSPCVVEGRLLRPDGTIAGGARLALVLMEPFPSFETLTDETGFFRFEGLPPARYVLRLLEDPTGAPAASCFVEARLEAGERHWQEVTLAEAHTLRGRALDGVRPLGDRIVELTKNVSGVFPRDRRRVRTTSDGSFAFASLTLGQPYVLKLLGPGAASDPRQATVLRVIGGASDVLLRTTEAMSLPGSLAGRFESDVPELLPTALSLRRNSFSEPILVRVDPATGEFSATGLPPDDYHLRAWVPRLGTWRAESAKVLPGERTELLLKVPSTGSLHVLVDLGETESWDELEVSVGTVAFNESKGGGGNRRLAEDRARNRFTADLLPGEYPLRVSLDGIMYEARRVLIAPGQTTLETVFLRGAIPMNLGFSLDRLLQEGERVSLTIMGAALPRNLELQAVKALSFASRVYLTRDTRELRIETGFGLTGRLVVTEADIVRGGALSMKLEEPVAR